LQGFHIMIEQPSKPDVPQPPADTDVVNHPRPDINPVPLPDIPPEPLPDQPGPQHDGPGVK
jgi:hypothetical protein